MEECVLLTQRIDREGVTPVAENAAHEDEEYLSRLHFRCFDTTGRVAENRARGGAASSAAIR